jgi:hypothetical protein
MIDTKIFEAMASSSKATQLVQVPCSSQSTHNTVNVDSELGNGASMEEPMDSCQKHSRVIHVP